MKKIYFTLLLMVAGTFVGVFAQEESCYTQYRKVFEKRGAFPVEDGAHDNIILTVRDFDGNAECYVARAVVKNGVIIEVDLYYEDGTFDKVEYEFKDKVSWSIFNGMSKTRVTEKDEKINIMFVDKVKPKKKKLMKAPKPNFDL